MKSVDLRDYHRGTARPVTNTELLDREERLHEQAERIAKGLLVEDERQPTKQHFKDRR